MNRFWPLGEPIIKFDTLPLLLASPFVEHEAEPSLGRSEPVVSRNSLRFCYSNRYAPLERLRCKSVGHVRQAGPNALRVAIGRCQFNFALDFRAERIQFDLSRDIGVRESGTAESAERIHEVKRSWQDCFGNGQLHIVHADTGELIGRKDSSCQ